MGEPNAEARQALLQTRKDLQGLYTDIQLLGRKGGMGILCKGFKPGLNVEVVIKRAKSRFKGRLDERAEAEILKNLKHTYLPRIYDILDCPSGFIYTVMDLIPGMDMRQYVKANGPVDQKRAYRWLCQLCEVTAHLHTQPTPILHCDIKPSNIMITPEDNICLIDFNTSLFYADGIVTKGVTDGYAAPEQYEPRSAAAAGTAHEAAYQGDTVLEDERPGSDSFPVPAAGGGTTDSSGTAGSVTAAQTVHAGEYGGITKRTDVYSIGASICYALTGKVPARSLDPVRQLSEYRLPLTRAFVSIVEQAMRKRPEARFADAGAMLRALKDIVPLDARFRHVLRLKKLFAAAEVLLVAASAASFGFGAQRLHIERETAYYDLVTQARTLAAEGWYDEAKPLLEEAVALIDTRIDAYVEQAAQMYALGQFDSCIYRVNELLTLCGESADALQQANACYLAGSSCYELEKYADAASWFERAIQISPQVRYYRDLAITQMKNGQAAGARQTMEEMAGYVQTDTDKTEYAMAAAEMDAANGSSEKALEGLLEVIQNTDDLQILSRAYLLADQKYADRGTEALDDRIRLLEEACAVVPAASNSQHMEVLAAVYNEKARVSQEAAWYEKSLRLFEQLSQRQPSAFMLRQNIAILQQTLDRFEDAQETLLALEEDYPNDYRPPMRLAYLYADWENEKEGQKDYAKMLAYYNKALPLYEIAQASGAEDSEMIQLKKWTEDIQNANG